MNNDLEYKGYSGSVEFSAEDKRLFGKVLFVESLLMYSGESVAELESAFQETVDSYLAFCAETGRQPNKPYSGTFNVRTGEDLHRQSAMSGHKLGMSLNEFVIYSLKTTIANIVQDPVVQTTRPTLKVVYSATATPPTEWEPLSATTH